MLAFAENMNLTDNGVGGIWRAGTGSAMEYIWKGEKCPATADGRLDGEPYSSSFSPALDAKCGLLSVIQSFTKFDMKKIINGGPLTVEIHDSTLRGDIGIEKVAMVVKSFIDLGGHQLQLNSVNRERLLDAQAHPEKYPGLIVRVWGWSGYFSELDVKYQNHIIRRVEHTI
jgi:formate C-acetyltransferase